MSERGRCTGHCCRAFSVFVSPDDAAAMCSDYWRRSAGGAAYGLYVDGGPTIGPMLVPLGFGRVDDLEPKRCGVPKKAPGWRYTCSHFDGTSCGIYSRRPRMCSAYPYGNECEYAGCTCDGVTGVLGRRLSSEDVVDGPVPPAGNWVVKEPGFLDRICMIESELRAALSSIRSASWWLGER